MISAGAPIAAMWFADRQMGPSLIAYGRPDQQADFLPKILSGETTWCIGMSEPDAGSDLAALKTISGAATGGRGNVGVAALAKAGEAYDVVDRFFAPGSGIPEDPTTGSEKLRALFDNKDNKLFPAPSDNIRHLVDT